MVRSYNNIRLHSITTTCAFDQA